MIAQSKPMAISDEGLFNGRMLLHSILYSPDVTKK